MDKYGFEKSESILNEWNYVKCWTDDWVYSLETESGRFNQKAAAFIASTMIVCQSVPLDLLMFYDARFNTGMNSLFNGTTLWPMKGYYPFYAWSKLVDRGTQVACTVTEGRGKKSTANTGTTFKSEIGKPVGSFRAAAAKGADGSGALLVARTRDNCTMWPPRPCRKGEGALATPGFRPRRRGARGASSSRGARAP